MNKHIERRERRCRWL